MLRRYLLLLCLLGPASAALAESVYVNDALYIGLHQDNTLASTIIELIPSGTELELLAREDKLLQVRTQTGITGWVDSSFISEQAPGRAQVADLESRLSQSAARVTELEEKLRQAEQATRDAIEQAAQERNNQPVTEPAPAPSTAIPSTTLREMQTLAEENQRLKQQVAELEAVQTMAVERVQAAESARKRAQESRPDPVTRTSQEAPGQSALHWTGLKYWQQILIGSVLLLAFAIGGWLVDLSVRRRHGGHRL